ncbi:MAG TPA: CoA-transferase [Trebonia sp.]|jgi:glutaconate CoA-transferase subunit B|nr:CoA-transferase [Trebonia sp.]
MSAPATVTELLTVLAARELAGRRIVFAGIGLPTLAVALAQLTVAPGIEIIYESGVTGAHPAGLPTTISDSILVTGAEAVLPMPQLFGYVIQGQRIDTGFLGAAQIDRHGSLNSTLIGGSYARPEHRLPGSGGAIEVMAHAREVFVVMRRHTPQTLVDRLDFVTSPAPSAGTGREASGRQASGRGVTRLITPLGVLTREDDELVLRSVNPGVDVAQVRAATGWPLKTAAALGGAEPPTAEELRVLREVLDPGRIYLR